MDLFPIKKNINGKVIDCLYYKYYNADLNQTRAIILTPYKQIESSLSKISTKIESQRQVSNYDFMIINNHFTIIKIDQKLNWGKDKILYYKIQVELGELFLWNWI